MIEKDKYLTFSKFENTSNMRSAVKLRREHCCLQVSLLLTAISFLQVEVKFDNLFIILNGSQILALNLQLYYYLNH